MKKLNEHRICFLHMPKTAGTSITQTLESYYDDNKVIKCTFMHEYKEFTKEQFADYLLYRGHVHYQFGIENFPDDTQYITVLRDPVERIISQFYYITKFTDESLDALNLAPAQRQSIDLTKSKGIKAYLLSDLPDITQSTRNQQLRILLGNPWVNQNQANTDAVVEKTLEILEGFRCVGVQEFLPFFMLEMCNSFAFDHSPLPRINENPDKQERHEQLSRQDQDDVLEIIQQFNAPEMLVYNTLKQQVQERINSVFCDVLEGNYTAIQAQV